MAILIIFIFQNVNISAKPDKNVTKTLNILLEQINHIFKIRGARSTAQMVNVYIIKKYIILTAFCHCKLGLCTKISFWDCKCMWNVFFSEIRWNYLNK